MPNISDNSFYCGDDLALYTPLWFFDREIKCGSSVKKIFSKLFKLTDSSKTVLKEITWKRNYFEIVLISHRSSFKLILKKFKKSENKLYKNFKHFTKAGHFAVLCNNEKPSQQISNILSSLPITLKSTKPSKIFKLLFNDKTGRTKQARSYLDIEMDKNNRSFPDDLYFDWGNPLIEFQFIYYNMVKARASRGINILNTIHIEHGDWECVNVEGEPRLISFLDMPTKEYSLKTVPGEAGFNEQLVSTLDDDSIVMGGIPKLKRILKTVLEKNPERVHVNSCCTPEVIGDDVISVVKNLKNKSKTTLFYSDHGQNTSDDVFMPYFRKLFIDFGIKGDRHSDPEPFGFAQDRLREGEESAANNSKNINMIGYNNNKSTEELASILELFKIKLNEVVLPEIDPRKIEKFFNAKLNILFPRVQYEHLYEEIFKKIDMDHITPPVPYGMKGTDKWLDAIINYFRISSESDKWLTYRAEIKKRWQELGKRAGSFHIGFVLTDIDIDPILNHDKFIYSIPIFQVLDEMGFKIKISIFTTKEKFYSYKLAISALFEKPEKHSIEHCNSSEDLNYWLSAPDLNCVYSDLAFDSRIASKGKSSFSSIIFEKGYEGSIRSLERLLERCNFTNLNDYQEHLKVRSKPRPLKIKLFKELLK